jgi:dehydrogenase/reductase SDR family member 7
VSADNVSVTVVCPGPVVSEISTTSFVNPNYPRQEEGQKMPTARCAQLTLRGVYHKLPELWISEEPVLAMAYVTQYLPYVSKLLFTKILGPARVKALQGGQNIYDLKTLLTAK